MKLFPVVGVLAGGDLPPGHIARLAGLAEFVVAADSGADRCLAEGVTPDLTLGDFDSLISSRADLREVLHLPDQETTDVDKLLAETARRGYRRIVLTGVEGDLPDHFLATLQSAAKSSLEVWFALRRGVGRVLRDGDRATVASAPGDRVSLIPLLGCTGVVTEGLAWEVPEGRLHPLGPSGVSNRATASSIDVRLGTGALFLFAESADEPISRLASSFKRP